LSLTFLILVKRDEVKDGKDVVDMGRFSFNISIRYY